MIRDAGILYIATGEKYRQETLRSAGSAKNHMPSIPVALFADWEPGPGESRLFDDVYKIDNPTFSSFDKIYPLIKTPFKKTLFVDTDTFFLTGTVELFLLLDKFDLAYCHAPCRLTKAENDPFQGIPGCFPMANTGVLLYNMTDDFVNLVVDWAKLYQDQYQSPCSQQRDQPAFRRALFSSKIHSYVLPPEYNMRTPMPMFKGAGIGAKILHGRGPSLEKAISQVRPDDRYFRVYDFSKRPSVIRSAKKLIKRLLRG